MMEESQGAERRQFTRIPLTCPISLTPPAGEGVQGTVVDISIHGLLARFGEKPVPEGPVRICVTLPDGHPSFTIEADGEVVRRSPEGFVGIYFLRTDVDSLGHLQRLLALNMEDPEEALYESYLW